MGRMRCWWSELRRARKRTMWEGEKSSPSRSEGDACEARRGCTKFNEATPRKTTTVPSPARRERARVRATGRPRGVGRQPPANQIPELPSTSPCIPLRFATLNASPFAKRRGGPGVRASGRPRDQGQFHSPNQTPACPHLRPEHPSLASLRLLARPSQSEGGATPPLDSGFRRNDVSPLTLSARPMAH